MTGVGHGEVWWRGVEGVCWRVVATVGGCDGCYMVVTCMLKMVLISFLGLILCERGF